MKSKLKVAMIAPPWLPVPPTGVGGIENAIHTLVTSLMKEGVHVELFATGDSKIKVDKLHYILKEAQYEHFLKCAHEASAVVAAHMIFSINKIREIGDFDIIHDHNYAYGPLVLSQNYDKNLPPALHTLHGPQVTVPEDVEKGFADNRPMWEALQKGSPKLYYTAVSKAFGDTHEHIQSHMLDPVYNSVDVEDFPFISQKEDYFCTLARFDYTKGQDLAARFCKELGCSIRMAGAVHDVSKPEDVLKEINDPNSPYKGNDSFIFYKSEILPRLDDKIVTLGEIKGDYKLRTIGKAKALLFPIRWKEPFGVSVIETLACGTPVVAFARGALPEIIQHGVNGFLANNEAEFKKYMQRVDEIDPVVCRKSVEDRFSTSIVAKSQIDRYYEVIEKSKNA